MVARRAPPSRDNVDAPHLDVKRRVPSGAPIGAAIGAMIAVADKQRPAPFPHQAGADRNGLRRAATPVPRRADLQQGRRQRGGGDKSVDFGTPFVMVGLVEDLIWINEPGRRP